ILSFFFQAEDGIRDRNVTGVQTCALPIWSHSASGRHSPAADREARSPVADGVRVVRGESRGFYDRRGISPFSGRADDERLPPCEIGRASCRERGEIAVCDGVWKKKDEMSE